MVERHVANVKATSSSLVYRSRSNAWNRVWMLRDLKLKTRGEAIIRRRISWSTTAWYESYVIVSQRHNAGLCPYKTKEGQKWGELPSINAHNLWGLMQTAKQRREFQSRFDSYRLHHKVTATRVHSSSSCIGRRGPASVSNGKDNRCHEAIQIYTLVEVDAERQIIEKTEFTVR